MNYSIHKWHILSILNILIEEIIKDLKNGKNLHIKNFGYLSLNKLKPKKIISLNSQTKFVKSTKSLRLRLSKHIYNFFKHQYINKIEKAVERKDQNEKTIHNQNTKTSSNSKRRNNF